MKKLKPCLFILLISACLSAMAQQSIPELTLVWTLEGLESPESVLLSQDNSFLYVSNVNGGGGDKDGNGYIARVSLTGELLECDWVDGLNAPKGLGLKDGKLYVSDIDQVVIIDTATESIEKRIEVSGADFLNDITVNTDGTVLISDSGNSTIYKLNDNKQAEVLMTDDSFSGINGLLPHDGQLLITTMDKGELLSLDVATQNINVIAGSMKNADGITPVTGGGYIVSSWPGQLFYVSDDGESTELLNTTEDKKYMNDFMLLGDILLIPNWQPGSLSAYQLKW